MAMTPNEAEPKLRVIELAGWQHSIAYTPLHPSYGRAEFQVCPIWKRGRIVECWIYPRQQVRPEGDVCWHFEANSDGLTVSGLGPTDEPKLWHIGWCRDHKTATYSIYVPNYTNTLEIMVMSSLSLRFVGRKAKS
jgi:hypothetical protein